MFARNQGMAVVMIVPPHRVTAVLEQFLNGILNQATNNVW
eukprot:CAMPEP_0117650962 /NCGR_PEP_ID=MMETSP0804-20121206/1829_1 /TAXON_ID=1074897 /ORGANISM="Tetraselmis astigmatica, Strain CCMP880" /LENGTH=39 /DNA_ID= /DNA_START= /DNA_END= /DNA_ORIENTATION=